MFLVLMPDLIKLVSELANCDVWCFTVVNILYIELYIIFVYFPGNFVSPQRVMLQMFSASYTNKYNNMRLVDTSDAQEVKTLIKQL